jgi:hypothetical protein
MQVGTEIGQFNYSKKPRGKGVEEKAYPKNWAILNVVFDQKKKKE